ncbi:unnamed protein product [Rotaria sordida]|uniref:Uncharacterized protein n=1 Tax=Rotaria sordida TaxID=392033 RepID=A0A818W6S1_9BILA|nr:unnamed protein product [Rotaria sordida]CAF3721146.1 unnamed protein product [Rotaria sordida]CAF3767190.1 unnamed protein product [Rotaria sordida]
MGDESGDSEKSNSTMSLMPTSNKLGDDDAKISFTTIKTDGLEHTSKDYPTSIYDALSTVIQIMKNIADDLPRMFANELQMNYNDSQSNQIHTLELLIDGS